MKIIDLLNKIANGEEVPNKIKYDDCKYLLLDGVYERTDNYDYLFDSILIDMLNDEVEILEEEKKIPEKLRTWYSVEEKRSLEENCEFANHNFETFYEKINDICDYLKSKGE